MRVTGRLLRGYPGDHRIVRARHRARLAALRCRSSRARRDRSGCAAAHPHATLRPRVGGRMRADLARALAAAFLAGEWTQPGLVASGATVLGRRARWLPPLVRQTLALYPRAPVDRPRELAANLASRPAAAKALRARPPGATGRRRRRWSPTGGGCRCSTTSADVASFLRVSASDLDWFADPRHLARTRLRRPPPALPRLPPRRAQRRHPRPGGTQAAAQGRAAPPPPRGRRAHPAARRGPGLPARRLGAVLRRAPRRPERRAAAGPRGVLRERDRLPGLRHLAHRRLPRAGRALPGRPGDQRPAALVLARGADPGGRRPARRPLAARSPARRATPAAGCADVAGDGQPGGVPARRAPHRAGPVVGRALHEVRRRPGVLGRARLGHGHVAPDRRGRGDRRATRASGSTPARPG